MDKVFIDNLKVFGILGIHPHEQRAPQEIRISLAASTDISKAAINDDITQSVNYSTLAKDIIRFVKDSHYLTIEALIEALAGELMKNKSIEHLWLRVEKPDAVPQAQSVGVEINRDNDL